MPEQQAVQTRFAERVREAVEDFAPRVAKLRRPVLGNVPVSKEERRRRWWQEDDGWSPEHERMLLTATMPGPDGVLVPLLDANGRPKKPMSPEDVGLLRFPYREVDAVAFGMDDDRKIAEYAQEMTALGPPDPDPLEQIAMQARPPEAASSAPPMAPVMADAPGVPAQEGY